MSTNVNNDVSMNPPIYATYAVLAWNGIVGLVYPAQTCTTCSVMNREKATLGTQTPFPQTPAFYYLLSELSW